MKFSYIQLIFLSVLFSLGCQENSNGDFKALKDKEQQLEEQFEPQVDRMKAIQECATCHRQVAIRKLEGSCL